MMTSDPIKIANNIRAERSRANISTEEVAKIIDMTATTLQAYEKNASKIQVITLIKLAQVYKCDISSFFV